LQPKFFQVLHVVFAFRGVFHDPLRELRPDALKLLLSVRLDTLGTQFLPSGIKSAREIVQCVWNGPSSWAKSPQLPSASPVNEAENQQKQHCTQRGADDGGDDPRAKMDAQSR